MNNSTKSDSTIKTIKITSGTAALLKKGVDTFNLSSTDIYTIKDLIFYSGLQDESLISVLLLLFLSFKNGSLCIKLDDKNTIEKLRELVTDSVAVINTFKKNITKYSKIIACTDKEFKPIVYIENLNASLYLHKHYIGEQKLKNDISHLLSVISDDISFGRKTKIINALSESPLNDKQKISVFLSILQNFVVISGGPGTGKSSIIYWIVKILLNMGYSPERIKVSAPTGRAANRLAEILKDNGDSEMQQIKCLTVHRLLEYSMRKGAFKKNRNKLITADLVIVDEVSMVDVNLMSFLFDALPEQTKVVFLGDKDQLPSVNVGAVLSDIIPNEFQEKFSDAIKPLNISQLTLSPKKEQNTDRIIILEKSYRTRGKALEIAKAIRDGKLYNNFEKFIIDESQFDKTYLSDNSNDNNKTENFLFINYSQINRMQFIVNIKQWSQNYLLNDRYIDLIKNISRLNLSEKYLSDSDKKDINLLFDMGRNSRILCTVKSNIFGTNYINKVLKEHLASKLFIDIGPGENYLFEGLPIIISENDYNLKLFNGDLGIIVKDNTNNLKAIFKSGGNKFVFHQIGLLPNFDIGFAITVHKSQGSEYNRVLLLIPDSDEIPLLTREIIYTGLTRSKENCIIYGNVDIFKKIIKKKIVRQSNLNFW